MLPIGDVRGAGEPVHEESVDADVDSAGGIHAGHHARHLVAEVVFRDELDHQERPKDVPACSAFTSVSEQC